MNGSDTDIYVVQHGAYGSSVEMTFKGEGAEEKALEHYNTAKALSSSTKAWCTITKNGVMWKEYLRGVNALPRSDGSVSR